MPAILRTVRANVLALLTLGLMFSAFSPAQAAPAPVSESGTATSDIVLTQPTPRVTRAQRSNRRVLAARDIAMRQRGDAYQYGAAGPNRFDCSGLIHFSFRRAGVKVPRTSGAQAAHTRRIPRGKMRAGDLMFFHSGGRVYHAAMFLRWQRGKAVMLHAPGSGKRVRVDRPWTSSWFAGTLRRR